MIKRNTKTVTVSVDPKEFALLERLAVTQKKTKSQLFREMLDTYAGAQEAEALAELVDIGAKKRMASGLKSVAEIDRIIHEVRGIKS